MLPASAKPSIIGDQSQLRTARPVVWMSYSSEFFCRAGIAAVRTIMLQAAAQRGGILTEERLQAALKPGSDLHQARAASCGVSPPRLQPCTTASGGARRGRVCPLH